MRVKAFLFLLLFPLCAFAADAPPQRPVVIASFGIIADLAKNVAGDAIEIQTLIPAGADAHTYEPIPADAKRVAEARVILANGLGFETWLPKLVNASRNRAWVVEVSKNVKPIMTQSSVPDPHAWQDVKNAIVYVEAIRDALVMADAPNEAKYRKNAADYIAKLTELDTWAKSRIAEIPEAKRRAIIAHNAMGYFAKAYGVTFIAAQGISTEGEVTAKTMATLIDQLRAQSVNAVFLENMGNPRVIEQLARDGNATIGGELYSDSFADKNGSVFDYISLIKHNVNTITAAMMKNLS